MVYENLELIIANGMVLAEVLNWYRDYELSLRARVLCMYSTCVTTSIYSEL